MSDRPFTFVNEGWQRPTPDTYHVEAQRRAHDLAFDWDWDGSVRSRRELERAILSALLLMRREP